MPYQGLRFWYAETAASLNRMMRSKAAQRNGIALSCGPLPPPRSKVGFGLAHGGS